jgi:hypothetical protein
VLLLLSLSVSAFAGQVSLMLENDVTYHTDFYYSHGTRIQYLDDANWGISVNQNMYTPVEKTIKELIPDDRPYAGYLDIGVFDTIYFDDSEFFIEGQIGTIGPHAYAEETQTLIHKWIGSVVPLGWSNQIPNHATILIITRYTTHIFDNKYFAIDPYVGAQVGNLADNLNCGFNIYAGYNLPSDRNNQRVIPFKGIKGIDWNPYAYVYAGIEPRLVLYSMMLEDHRFTIHPEYFVYDENAGLVIGCKYFELAFTFCLRSKEFEEQPKPEKYGAAKISFNF